MDAIVDIIISQHDVHLLSTDMAWHYKVVPKEQSQGILHLYCEDTADQYALLPELEVLLDTSVRLTAIPVAVLTKLLAKYYLKHNTGQDRTEFRLKNADDFLMNLINEAKNLKSSDIHIEIYETKCRVRIRIDGMMVERYLLSKEEYPALINKIKIIANLDIAEKRLPQDGRISFRHNDQQFDIRVSILPTLYGEKVVLRLLNNDATIIDLNSLGFSVNDLANFLQGVKRPNGILLISGPTGSGKTTTLYATLKLLNKETQNILTIEDPIEYTIEGINQVQLKETIGLSFSVALKTFLRQDPDVIMVGEIRDSETANMAIRAALTGHLVLSTIHTNSAWGTVSRLIDMGVPPFLLANTLNTTAAQRLVRLLCSKCKTKISFDETFYPHQFKPYHKIEHHYLAKGCNDCYYTGYKGRKAVYEVIHVDKDIAAAVKSADADIGPMLKERGVKTLAENAFELFSDGLTSLEEIYPLLYNY